MRGRWLTWPRRRRPRSLKRRNEKRKRTSNNAWSDSLGNQRRKMPSLFPFFELKLEISLKGMTTNG